MLNTFYLLGYYLEHKMSGEMRQDKIPTRIGVKCGCLQNSTIGFVAE